MSTGHSPLLPAQSAIGAFPSRLSSKAAFYVLASLPVSFLAGSMAPTPLYPVYQAEWGFSAATLTMIYSVYAAALLGALLIAGRLSDHIGRKPVLVAATLGQALTMLLFISAHGPDGLMLARFVQGLSTGSALGAIGASMIDLNKKLGPTANSIAPMTGTAIGGLLSGLMVHFLPAPTILIYATLLAIYLVQIAAITLMTEPVTRRSGALASLVPQIALPKAARQPMLLATPILLATWSLAGFYASLGPAILRGAFHIDASLGGGVVIFILAGTGALTIVLSRALPVATVMTFGGVGLAVGSAASLVALSSHSLVGFLASALIAGAGFGAGFQGAVGTVAPTAKPHERAGVLSVLFIISYVTMGAPAIVAGLFIAHGADLMLTAQIFGGFVGLSATLALLGLLWGPVRHS